MTHSEATRMTTAVAEFTATFIQEQNVEFARMSSDGWTEAMSIIVEHGIMLHEAMLANPCDDWYGVMNDAAQWLGYRTLAASMGRQELPTPKEAQDRYDRICKENA